MTVEVVVTSSTYLSILVWWLYHKSCWHIMIQGQHSSYVTLSVELSRSDIVNPNDFRRSTPITLVSDPVSGMQSWCDEDSPDCTNSLIVSNAGPIRDSVSIAQILAMFHEAWEIEHSLVVTVSFSSLWIDNNWQSDPCKTNLQANTGGWSLKIKIEWQE